jgi:CheY-like chemotaxis protein
MFEVDELPAVFPSTQVSRELFVSTDFVGQPSISDSAQAIAAGQSPSASGEQISASLLGSGAAPKVMMVDDEKLNNFIVAEYLKAAGYRDLAHTTDPLEAIALADRVRPDLILLDLQMPELSGFDLLRLLRADATFERTSIVILSASTTAEERQRALHLGANDFLQKPIERQALLDGVRKAVAENVRLASEH